MTQMWVYALIAIAIGHFLATVGLYYYLARRDTGNENEDTQPSSIPKLETDSSPRQSGSGAHEYVVCSECETANEPGYRYCRQCVAPLGSGTDRNRNERGPDSPWIR